MKRPCLVEFFCQAALPQWPAVMVGDEGIYLGHEGAGFGEGADGALVVFEIVGVEEAPA